VNFTFTDCTQKQVNGFPAELLVHAKMYETADKYDVVGLKELAQDKFRRSCAAFWDEDAFAVAAYHAYFTTMAEDKGLKDIVISTISEHMELIHKPTIETLMTEFSGLCLGILKRKSVEHGWGKKNLG
jgi:hypothetical protein